MTDTNLRTSIKAALGHFASSDIDTAARQLFSTLGYQSDRTVPTGSVEEFLQTFDTEGHFLAENVRESARLQEWKTVQLLFQITDAELSGQGQLFDAGAFEPGNAQSYLFFAVELTGTAYPRGTFANITRRINRLFPTPVMVLFKYGSRLTIAVINRRPSKVAPDKDVLGKVTLIQDINYTQPHPGHLDIIGSFSVAELRQQKKPIANFDQLHAAWEEVFNVELLNKRFYRELSSWYFWARQQVEFPADLEPDAERRSATSVIRLLTRLIFCWFLKEKGLIPDTLFDNEELDRHLKSLDKDDSTYYRAILQNLFFATLNQQMNVDGEIHRRFVTKERFNGRSKDHGVKNLYRYEDAFRDPAAALALFEDIPFLNGGLFACLDRADKDNKELYADGFSDNRKHQPVVPNNLFFAEPQQVDLSDAYGDKKFKKETVQGLIHILRRYKFTIAENTPVEQEIALDPELLGKVFENLLASYNPETGTTARKQTGSFYTPRPIVDYMVDESLKAYLAQELVRRVPGTKEADARDGLDILFAYTEKEHAFTAAETTALIAAIDACNILDPACGSGAFPMGILHKLVFILQKLDPENKQWHQRQVDKAEEIADSQARESAIQAINRDFEENAHDYGRKLYLIENCIYGVDIQPIAIQISKLRFFISLVCDQCTNGNRRENFGIKALPNLETKFVAANTLLKLDQPEGYLPDANVEATLRELERVRHLHFSADSRAKKLRLQTRDKELRQQLEEQLMNSLMPAKAANDISAWDPYDMFSVAQFFDPRWMFGQELAEGFDIVIGNPPYGFRNVLTEEERRYFRRVLEISFPSGDVAEVFVKVCFKELLTSDGILTLIIPKKALYGDSWQEVRKLWNTHDLRMLLDVSKGFQNVLLEQSAFTLLKSTHNSMVTVAFLNPETVNLEILGLFKVEDIFSTGLKNAQIYKGLYPKAMLRKIENASYTDKVFTTQIGRGGITKYLTTSETPFPCLKGIDIGRYGLQSYRYVSPAIGRKLYASHNPGTRIIGQEILAHIQNPKPHIMTAMAVCSKPLLVNDTCIEIRPSNTCAVGIHFLACYLMSQFVAWFSYNLIYNRAIRTMHFIDYYTSQIPVPAGAIENDEIAEEFKQFYETMESSLLASDEALAKQVQHKIDTRVFDLFNLSEEEVEIITSDSCATINGSILPLISATDAIYPGLGDTSQSADTPSLFTSADEAPARRYTPKAPPATDIVVEIERRTTIDDISQEESLARIRKVFEAAGTREGAERDEALRDLSRQLGFKRLGSNIREELESDLRTAVRRRIIERVNGDGTYRLATRSIEDYLDQGRDKYATLRRFLCAAVGPSWTLIDDAITKTARHLGFARTGDNIRATLETTINSAINKGELEKRGQEIRVQR